ncbi:hypothetical protein PanWU01x14_040270 [Parasponia andersonii]|uniref:Uncharacterized protein n=1 Tax=Parasponia andersonii TaxID=3476 RepID=A0A2P5DR50_PARAD|nr:hypothetical protein PanWU01x14_040270 [Parasponia andersonii]
MEINGYNIKELTLIPEYSEHRGEFSLHFIGEDAAKALLELECLKSSSPLQNQILKIKLQIAIRLQN